MEHLIVLFYILSFTLGFSVILIVFFLWLKNRNSVLKHFLLFAVSLTLILIEQMITAYVFTNVDESVVLTTIMRFVSAVGCSLLIYSFTRLVRMLLEREMSAAFLRGLAGYSLVPVVAAVIYSFIDVQFVLWMASVLLFINILYNTVTLLVHNHRIITSMIRSGIRNLAIVTLVLFPILFADIFIERINFFGEAFTFGLLSVFIFYTVFSAMSLYNIVRGFNKLISHTYQPANTFSTDQMPDAYRITNREKEIIDCLLTGATYRQIGEKLSISLPTVKTHVANIYKKIGVQNKIELLNAVKKHNNKS